MPQTKQTRLLVGIGVVIRVLTVFAYGPIFRADFVNYDDQRYVTENSVVKNGLTWKGIAWSFSTGRMGSWHPLTWLGHMTDVQLFGLNPVAHHAVNVGLHTVNSLLLFLLFYQLTGAIWRSAFVAAVFALHTLHVESVAWVAERKDVLSGFFGLLTLIAYAKYVQATQARRRRALYGLTILLFACGLMSKPMLVTWPVLMLL